MFVTVWEYEVRLGMEAAFEQLYGEHGAWVLLFREQPGYLHTDLLRGERHGHYLTLDHWRDARDYTAFQQHQHSRYAQIDAQGDALTLSERHVGTFIAPDTA